MYVAKGKRSVDEREVEATTTPKRTEVLAALWRRARWIDSRIDNSRTKLTPILKYKVYMAQVFCQYCRTLLYGLRGEELEIRVREIEEKLKDGVIIPNDRSK